MRLAVKIFSCLIFQPSFQNMPTQAPKTFEIAQLDGITGGAFSAPTSGERAARVKEWLAGNPDTELQQAVFKELSVKDKGAARWIKERLDEARRAKGQEQLMAEWALRAQTLLDAGKIHMADAMAWQRDAAKAGAPLSKEPLAALKVQLAERVRAIEDLEHHTQVQREAAVLLAQRIEILSTKSWQEAQAAATGLRADVAHWQAQALELQAKPGWPSVDVKFAGMLDASLRQLTLVSDAFDAAAQMAVAASLDPAAPLPPVPVWAEALRAARGEAVTPKPAKAAVDPEVRAQAVAATQAALDKLETEIAEGHGKASAGAANALRQTIKEYGKLIDAKLEARAQAALAAAGELEGWQRWRADQLRQELVTKAEGLLQRPEGQTIGGRKMQESLRTLREQWKLTDQGGVPNHGLWKRFDHACNDAYKVVEAWLEKIKADAVEHRAQRLALIAEVDAWAADNRTALDDDWKGFQRILMQFGDRWRNGGHLGEKAFAELQPLWKTAIDNAAAPLEAVQAENLALRRAMVDEAQALGAAPELRIDAVKSLQQRWQRLAQGVPLDRRLEQKLWDAFRRPIDEAFNRKTAEREKAQAHLGARDRAVIDASQALQAANASNDAQRIRQAMADLDAALRGQLQARAAEQAASAQLTEAAALASAAPTASPDATDTADTGDAAVALADLVDPGSVDGLAPPSEVALSDMPEAAAEAEAVAVAEVQAEPVSPPPPPPAPRPVVVARRGDDRPGQQREAAPAPAGARRTGDRPGERSGAPRGAGPGMAGRPGAAGAPRDDRGFGRGFDDRRAPRADAADAPPRLGDAAFRAQREALEGAQQALNRMAVQAHGEVLVQLLAAWEQRDPEMLPAAQALGSKQAASVRPQWRAVLASGPTAQAQAAGEALLRLEMAAEVPTPAEFVDARRAFQLKLLTRRNDPPPAQTWAHDAATVFASGHEPGSARRLQAAFKVLLRR